MREQAERARARRARCGRSTTRRRGRPARRASSSRPAGRSRRTPRRRAAGCRAAARSWDLHRPMVGISRGGRRQASSSAVTPPPRKRPRGVSASVGARRARARRGRAAPAARARRRSSAARGPRARSGSSSRRPSITPLARRDVGRQLLELARRPLAALERREVARSDGAFRQRRPSIVLTAPTPSPR